MSSLPCPLHGRTRSRTPLATLAALLLAAVGPAQALEPTLSSNDTAPSPLHLEWTQSAGNPALANAPSPYGPAALQGNATRTMLWASRGRVAVGLGLEQRWTAPPGYPTAPALVGERDGQWLLGVSLQTSLQTRLVWQMPTANGPSNAYGATTGEPLNGQRSARLSLDWGHPDPYKGLLRGSLRFELARDTTVSIKPRGGHWSLALSSKW
ncbi:MAG: hypothetical protein U1F53_23950 [Burkholderiaceae bacterium]